MCSVCAAQRFRQLRARGGSAKERPDAFSVSSFSAQSFKVYIHLEWLLRKAHDPTSVSATLVRTQTKEGGTHRRSRAELDLRATGAVLAVDDTHLVLAVAVVDVATSVNDGCRLELRRRMSREESDASKRASKTVRALTTKGAADLHPPCGLLR